MLWLHLHLFAHQLEDLGEFGLVVVLEGDLTVESGAESGIEAKQLGLHVVLVARDDDCQVIEPLLGQNEQLHRHRLPFGIRGGLESVRFIDEKDAAYCRVDQLGGFVGTVASKLLALCLDEHVLFTRARLLEDLAKKLGNGSLARAWIAKKCEVLREWDTAVRGEPLLAQHASVQFERFFLDALQPNHLHELVERRTRLRAGLGLESLPARHRRLAVANYRSHQWRFELRTNRRAGNALLVSGQQRLRLVHVTPPETSRFEHVLLCIGAQPRDSK